MLHIDHSVFNTELVEDMTLIADVAHETFEEYEAKSRPYLLAFKLFNSKSSQVFRELHSETEHSCRETKSRDIRYQTATTVKLRTRTGPVVSND